jgi:serine/threonine protein kinase
LKQLLLALDMVIPEERSGVICRSCGTPLRGDEPLGGHCLACLLNAALDEEEPAEGIDPFDQYRLTRHADGTPVELGRGAMGITYKAFDVDLRRTVTLKIISGKYVRDESTRLRFLREARAAASIRHPNVASVFHLGRTNENYFYAMEFVEGETLENLIKRSGRLAVKPTLEILAQVAAGLAAVHKQKLVHRDIKPSNIMVSMDDGAATAKIIDLGLAKAAVNEPGFQSWISIPPGFSGTPEFASPEQLMGANIDIRSDLYSLGVTLWEMVTGYGLFKGAPVEMMYQHRHAPLPVQQLEGVPGPLVALIQVLLEKDPSRRFQTPIELLKAVSTMTRAIGERQIVTFQNVPQMSADDSYSVIRKSPAKPGGAWLDASFQSLPHSGLRAFGLQVPMSCPERISIDRLPITGRDVFDREREIDFLNDAWANQIVNVVTIVGGSGVGKSTLVNEWLRRMAAERYRSAQLIYGWSFRQGSGCIAWSAEEFLHAALAWFGEPDPRIIESACEKGERLAKLISNRRTLLVLDALEAHQYPDGPQEGRLRDSSIQGFLRTLAGFDKGLCIVTTRLPVVDIADNERASVLRRDLQLWQKWRR